MMKNFNFIPCINKRQLALANKKKPSFYDIIAKAKWDAWKKISKMSKDDAKRKYVTLFTKVAKKINNDESKAVLKKMAEGNKIATAAAGGLEINLVHLYGTMLSQPTRSVFWFCQLNAIPIEFHEVNLAGGEQKSAEFTAINPLQKVPVVVYEGKTYFESHSIIRMLAQYFPVANNWYPPEFDSRLRVEQYLDWHHLNTRKACASLVFAKFFLPMRGGAIPEDRMKELEKDVHLALKAFDKVFLAGKPFIIGDEPSVADLFAYNEINQMDLIGGPHKDEKKYPNLVAWLQRMSLLPGHTEMYQSVHMILPSKL
mmetsp:Transcript_42824/g.65775  ORF Transcript_42824/g.65775 Transcript_42824/m.65775 type:complete len:313 (+) Transcript_42824:103-1041(+)